MTRKERRAAEHQARKAARKAGFANPAPIPTSALTAAPLARPSIAASPAASGLVRHNGVFKLLTSEDPAGFEALKSSLVSDHQPQTATESILVNQMAESHWLAQRFLTLQHTCLDPETGEIADTAKLNLYLRCQTTHQRAFHKSLSDLAKLRKEKQNAERGFEAQKRKDAELQMKEQAQALKNQIDLEEHAWQDPVFRQETIRKAQAKLNKDPEYPRLQAEWDAKYGKNKGQTPTQAA